MTTTKSKSTSKSKRKATVTAVRDAHTGTVYSGVVHPDLSAALETGVMAVLAEQRNIPDDMGNARPVWVIAPDTPIGDPVPGDYRYVSAYTADEDESGEGDET